jgi:hypothetical protein
MANADLAEQQAKVVHPVVMLDGGKDNPMTMEERPGWVMDRPPVGESIKRDENPPGPFDQDPAVINQDRTRDLPSMGAPGTPYTEDPETGFETSRTSPDMEERREQLIKDQKAAEKEARKAEREEAKEEKAAAKSDGKSESAKSEGSGSKA